MKIAVIGNSHCGAWRRAWDKLSSQHPSISLTFFAARRDMMNSLSVRDQCLTPETESLRAVIKYTSDGLEKIDPALFDVFLVCGLHSQNFAKFDREHYSQALYDRAIQDQFQGSSAFQVLTKIRAVTGKPIYFTHSPLPAYPPEKRPLARTSYQYQTSLLQSVLIALEVTFLPQPHETIIGETATNPRFSQGSRRLDTGHAENDGDLHPGNDIAHMNVEFGEIALRAFIDCLRQA